MSASCLYSEPNSEELASLLQSEHDVTSYSDDIEALQTLETESKRAKSQSGIVVQHRSWSTQDIFRSEPQGIASSPNMATAMPSFTSSPPLTPSPRKKRKHLDLGENQLSRPAKAQKTYYGIDIHRLLDDAQAEESIPKAARTIELPTPPAEQTSKASLLWTEKYRARKFTDLIGDERTHRSVMHWLKRWDPIIFPGSARPKKQKSKYQSEDSEFEKAHRKILMLTGPPGLGKTTLAHVCARQAGFEVQEINASDERSAGVVKGRVRDMVGTENVKGVDSKTKDGSMLRKAGKPVCVIIDEVDGVVTGSGGGEGGFIKALLDLCMLDSKNTAAVPLGTLQQAPVKKKKVDRFRLLRPIILICNDIYHPSLRPLRQSSHAEVIHVRKAPVQTLVSRLQGIFDREGVPCESDGVRRLCEAAWGVSNRKEDRKNSGAGEGDMRGIMVVGEWVAAKLRSNSNARLTRRWVEDNVLSDLAHGGGAARGLGRGGPKDIVERVFQEGAGFPASSANAHSTPQHQTGINPGIKGVAEGQKRTASERLRELIDTHGETDRIMTDVFTAYPEHPFQDDTLLSKPDAAYEWLHFHDRLSSAVFSNNEWELAPYLSTPVLGFHHLFASSMRANSRPEDVEGADTSAEPEHPFNGPQASWAAHEAEKQHTAALQSLHSSLTLDLNRLFTSHSAIATDFLPYLLRMVSPNVNPVVVGGSGTSTASVRKSSEQLLVSRSVQAMAASGVRFERTKVNNDSAEGSYGNQQWIYRMEPPLDEFGMFATGGKGFGGQKMQQRFAVRQVLDQEWKKEEKKRAEVARLARFGATNGSAMALSKEGDARDKVDRKAIAAANKLAVKRDFFGRPIAAEALTPGSDNSEDATKGKGKLADADGRRVWVTYHEGFSNAVRKPISLADLMKGL